MDVKRFTLAGVVLALLIAALMLLLAFVSIDAHADGPGAQDALVPRAWLPVVSRAGPQSSVSVQRSMAVVEPDMLFFWDLWARNFSGDCWDGAFYWDSATTQLLGVEYGDLLLVDVIPQRYTNHMYIGQWAWIPGFADEALLASAVLRVVDMPASGYAIVSAEAAFSGRSWLVVSGVYVMPCLGDYTGDGVRDVYDLQLLISKAGDSDASPLFDLDGDGTVTGLDAAIASLWMGVPCP